MSKRWMKWLPSVVLLVSCSPGMVYNKYQSTPILGWEKNDTLSFEVPRFTESDSYDVELGLRINNAYPFTALTIIVEQTVFPSGRTYKDTLDCELIDKHGREIGNGVSYFQYIFPIGEASLKAGDSLHVNIRHDMKREMLPGISDVGLQIRKHSALRVR